MLTHCQLDPGASVSEIWIYDSFIYENWFEDIACKMAFCLRHTRSIILIFVGLFEESVLLKLHDLISFQTNKLY